MLDEGGPIGQVRQGIVVRHMLDAGLRLLALGNVLRKADEVALFAALVRYREILGGQDAGAVVRGVNDVLVDGLQLARAQGLAGEREQIVRGFLAGYIVNGSADQLATRDSENRLVGGVLGDLAAIAFVLD